MPMDLFLNENSDAGDGTIGCLSLLFAAEGIVDVHNAKERT